MSFLLDFEPRETTFSGNTDELDQNRPLIKNRICDGIIDCPDSVDENGQLGTCSYEKVGGTECCQVYIAGGEEFRVDQHFL